MGEASVPTRRYRVTDFANAKRRQQRWAMLTSYDQYTAALFDQAGVWSLLVGDSAANNVYGYDSTLPVTVEELLPLVRAVVRSTRRAFVIGDLPFGSYEAGPGQALATAIRFMKEGGCHAVKFEGGVRVAEQIRAVSEAGIPVMAHIGFTPQSEHRIGGYRVQGRGTGAARLLEDARAVAEAGAFGVVLEMVPGDLAAQVTAELPIPTVGIGAGPQCDAQVLVWQDMLGLRQGKVTRFVKQYANLAQVISDAATAYVADVSDGRFPSDAHTFSSEPDVPPTSGPNLTAPPTSGPDLTAPPDSGPDLTAPPPEASAGGESSPPSPSPSPSPTPDAPISSAVPGAPS